MLIVRMHNRFTLLHSLLSILIYDCKLNCSVTERLKVAKCPISERFCAIVLEVWILVCSLPDQKWPVHKVLASS